VIFSDAGPDVRWCGNEKGLAGDPNWSTVDPAAVPYPGASGEGISNMLQHGDPDGSVWRPAETDVSIRPGWFYHPGEDDRVRPVDDLVELYFTSVGRNSKLLLNVPPTRAGLLHPTDVARLGEMRALLETILSEDVAREADVDWRRTGERSAVLELDLGRTTNVRVARLEEAIEHGQTVARYTIHGTDGGEWQVLSQGTTIGYTKLDRLGPVAVARVRLEIEDAAAVPEPVRVRLYGGT
jgi:alpha-L-fucosidase